MKYTYNELNLHLDVEKLCVFINHSACLLILNTLPQDYIHRFAKLKQSLNEFAELHPHPANPANAYACKVSPASISVHSLGSGAGSPSLLDDKIVVSANNEGGDVPNNSLNLSDPEMRQTQLEITVRGLLARLEATTASLEQVYRDDIFSPECSYLFYHLVF